MRVILFFFTLTMLLVGGLYLLVHREVRPDEPALPRVPQFHVPDLPAPPLEPAQPPDSHINKCIRDGKVLYTDDPCPNGHAERKLDPQRSKINVMPHETAKAKPESAPPRPVAPDIQLDDDGRVRRVPAG
jgi:hypothetical protein